MVDICGSVIIGIVSVIIRNISGHSGRIHSAGSDIFHADILQLIRIIINNRAVCVQVLHIESCHADGKGISRTDLCRAWQQQDISGHIAGLRRASVHIKGGERIIPYIGNTVEVDIAVYFLNLADPCTILIRTMSGGLLFKHLTERCKRRFAQAGSCNISRAERIACRAVRT